MSWHLGRLCAFDLETTSVDPEDARIVQAYAGLVGGGLEPVDVCDLVVDPGIPVPHEAQRIHGLTTEYVREHGDPADAAVDIIVSAVASALLEGVPLVGHNVRYDLTVLGRECRRHGLPTLEDRVDGLVGPVLDTQVLSKHVDQYRRKSTEINPATGEPYGAQQLRTCAIAFNVGWSDEDAHGARYDALTAARIAWRIGQIAGLPLRDRPRAQGRELVRFNHVMVPLARLHQAQEQWAREQDAGWAAYFREQAEKTADVDEQIEFHRRAESCTGHWPVYPFAAEQQGQLA
ncbi:exonuclease domain-containing protein [Actinomadura litoris]|uniref:exonuclease domain-containing protein n=1 Tax=Actinomadura litoris TaxID=2678616 RepID=UPI001FA74251|nr:exonuclease domain-containing protein [Actinomadura litoris]